MAKNDIVLLDGIVQQRISETHPSAEIGEVFELLALEQLLKDFDLSDEEVGGGWLDGRDDGGIDGFYIFINGHLLDEIEDFAWPRSNASIEIWLFTCKHHPTFQQAPLDSLLATAQELFDLQIASADLQGCYSESLLATRELFSAAYRRLAITQPTINVRLFYVSRGDSSQVGSSVRARGKQIENVLTSLFSSSRAVFEFVGASELVQMLRRVPSFSLSLPFAEYLATGRDSYVLLVRLEDYWHFVSDESGTLRRYLFDSNVRDYLGAHQVNDDIAKSLADISAPDFWWLNNGVTILATGATVTGKEIQLQDIQIVNGLQTTETVFHHFSQGQSTSRDRSLLVKIIVSGDPNVRDSIIRATNNQSPVDVAALRATDKIQRDIEQILERHDWYYERRKNYYRNQDKPRARLVTPSYLAGAVVSLLLKNPARAVKLKPKVLRDQASYETIFSDRTPIGVWPVLARVYREVDSHLMELQSKSRKGDRFLRHWRPLVSLLTVSRRLGTFGYQPDDLLKKLPSTAIDREEVADAWLVISQAQQQFEQFNRPRGSFVKLCCTNFAGKYGLDGLEDVGRRQIPSGQDQSTEAASIAADFLDRVAAALPAQPWKPGVHSSVATRLSCPRGQVSRAIQLLIAQGRFNHQRDGVVYGPDGTVLAVDEERVRPDDDGLISP